MQCFLKNYFIIYFDKCIKYVLKYCLLFIVFLGWLNLLAIRIGEPRDGADDICVGGVCVPNGGCVSYQDAYTTALYYSCTSLTTVGFGNVSANTKWEKVFSVVIMLIGGKLIIHVSDRFT